MAEMTKTNNLPEASLRFTIDILKNSNNTLLKNFMQIDPRYNELYLRDDGNKHFATLPIKKQFELDLQRNYFFIDIESDNGESTTRHNFVEEVNQYRQKYDGMSLYDAASNIMKNEYKLSDYQIGYLLAASTQGMIAQGGLNEMMPWINHTNPDIYIEMLHFSTKARFDVKITKDKQILCSGGQKFEFTSENEPDKPLGTEDHINIKYTADLGKVGEQNVSPIGEYNISAKGAMFVQSIGKTLRDDNIIHSIYNDINQKLRNSNTQADKENSIQDDITNIENLLDIQMSDIEKDSFKHEVEQYKPNQNTSTALMDRLWIKRDIKDIYLAEKLNLNKDDIDQRLSKIGGAHIELLQELLSDVIMQDIHNQVYVNKDRGKQLSQTEVTKLTNQAVKTMEIFCDTKFSRSERYESNRFIQDVITDVAKGEGTKINKNIFSKLKNWIGDKIYQYNKEKFKDDNLDFGLSNNQELAKITKTMHDANFKKKETFVNKNQKSTKKNRNLGISR